MPRWSILLFAITVAQSMPALAVAEPTVATQAGQLQGKLADGVEAFLGIPYAAAPSGAGDQSRTLPLAAINAFHNCAFWDALR